MKAVSYIFEGEAFTDFYCAHHFNLVKGDAGTTVVDAPKDAKCSECERADAAYECGKCEEETFMLREMQRGQAVEYKYGPDWLNATIVKVGRVKVTIDLEQFSNPNAGPVERRICRTSVMPEYLREKHA